MREMTYDEYHHRSLEIGDIDPSYEMLRYLCNRYELSMEQRYWLAYLYATCYSGPTVFYIYNEFPDFENVDVGRLQRWWDANKGKCLFQTDRRWVKSNNDFVPMFLSYREWIKQAPTMTQEQRWKLLDTGDPFVTYDVAFESAGEIKNMGRFSLFLFLEAVHVVTGFKMKPKSMVMKDADSCRNGLAEALGHSEMNTHGTDRKLSACEQEFLQEQFDELVARMARKDKRNNVWNIETTLCAYKKFKLGKRHVGFYLDRQADEIAKMRKVVPQGVDWNVLWQYRSETYNLDHLKECK